MSGKILVIDDDPSFTQTVRKALGDYEVLNAPDGQSGLDLAASEKPAVVLLDVVMPGMDGIEVLAKLNLMPERPVVIMLSGDDSLTTAAKTRAIGVYSFITKPFSVEELRAKVESAMDFSRKRNSAGG